MCECSVKHCSEEAVFGLLLDDTGEFARVEAAPKDGEHEAGDLDPGACERHKGLLAVKYQRLGEFRRIDDEDA